MEMRFRRIATLWLMIVSVSVLLFVFTFRHFFVTTTLPLQHQEDVDESYHPVVIKRTDDGDDDDTRLLCFVLVDVRNVDAAVAVKETWGQRGCDTLLFFRFVASI